MQHKLKHVGGTTLAPDRLKRFYYAFVLEGKNTFCIEATLSGKNSNL